VTTPPTSPQTHAAVAQQLVSQASQVWVKAGEQSDSGEGLGVDGRIALVHKLCDLSVKGWAAFVQCAIQGPFMSAGSSAPSEPLPSEPINVPATGYPRQLKAKGPFVRVGLPKITIPVSAIAFDPPFLPAGFTQFQVLLKDNNYIGANYTGTVLVSTQALVPDEMVVTVGL